MRVTLLLIIFLTNYASGLKIIGILPSPALSHFFIGSSILESLHNVGHEITIISPFSYNETRRDFYKEILFENLAKKFQSGMT
jgi:hypothetical protein